MPISGVKGVPYTDKSKSASYIVARSIAQATSWKSFYCYNDDSYESCSNSLRSRNYTEPFINHCDMRLHKRRYVSSLSLPSVANVVQCIRFINQQEAPPRFSRSRERKSSDAPSVPPSFGVPGWAVTTDEKVFDYAAQGLCGWLSALRQRACRAYKSGGTAHCTAPGLYLFTRAARSTFAPPSL